MKEATGHGYNLIPNSSRNVGQTAHQAFNTCISFMVNCNLQHYSGESGLTYFTQLFVIMLFQFITAATGMAAMAGIMKALAAKTTQTIGNFWNYLVLSCTRVLLPLSLVVGFILIVQVAVHHETDTSIECLMRSLTDISIRVKRQHTLCNQQYHPPKEPK